MHARIRMHDYCSRIRQRVQSFDGVAYDMHRRMDRGNLTRFPPAWRAPLMILFQHVLVPTTANACEPSRMQLCVRVVPGSSVRPSHHTGVA